MSSLGWNVLVTQNIALHAFRLIILANFWDHHQARILGSFYGYCRARFKRNESKGTTDSQERGK